MIPMDGPMLSKKKEKVAFHDENFNNGMRRLQGLEHWYGIVGGTVSGKSELQCPGNRKWLSGHWPKTSIKFSPLCSVESHFYGHTTCISRAKMVTVSYLQNYKFPCITVQRFQCVSYAARYCDFVSMVHCS